jgi:serine/threonine-protein kinase
VAEPTESTTPAVGSLVGKYRVESVLGKGGMGVVVGARHETLGHRVAIKILSSTGRAQPTALARFLREARATMELKSEHVVRMLDEGTTDDGSPYLVMEFLEGEDLMKILATRGPLPVEQAVEHVLQACDAMAEAHAHGIVHRDLKPANLFLTRRADGRALVKVLDFGISKLTSDQLDTELTETLAMLGSPTYMSPEQIRSAKTVDQRTDVWSLGVVLFRLLTQATPFVGQGAMAMCTAILNDAPQPPRALRPELPLALEEVVLRCLEKDPARRFPDMTELGRALAAFAPDGVTAARFRTAPLTLAAPLPPLTSVAAIVADPGTQAAMITHDVPVAPRPKRWPLAVGFVAVAATSLVAGLALRGREPPAPIAPAATVADKGSSIPVASASSSSPIPAASPAPSASPAPVASSAAPKIPVAAKPTVKPAGTAPPAKPKWGGAIDDPL